MFSISIKWWQSKGFCLSLFLAILCFNKSSGQIVQSARYERELSEEEVSFEVSSAQDKGILLYKSHFTIDHEVLDVTFLDTALQEKWRGYLPLEKSYIVANKTFYKESIFLLLRYRDFSKNDLQIIALNSENGRYLQYTFKNFIPFNPIEFHVTQEAAIVGGYFNRIPVVIYLNFATQKTKVVPGLFNEMGELTQVKTYPNGTFDVLVNVKNIYRQETIWIRNYDAEGTLLKKIVLEPEENKNLLFGRAIKTDNDKQLVAGVYGNRNSEYSKGLFLASIDPLGTQQLKYYNYADLENFFSYMRANREQRIKSRVERRKIKGKKVRFNYRFLVHELVPYQGNYILLGEAFYPRYTYTNNSFYGGTFNSYYPRFGPGFQNGQIFDGYNYTHAVVIGFDNQGQILWDNSFEINDVKTFTLEQFVKLDAREDKIALLYLFDNEIQSKIIKNNSVLEGKSSDPIKLKSENDFIKRNDSDITKLDYWYKNFFYAYGIQTIRSNNGNIKRKVFFINKINYP